MTIVEKQKQLIEDYGIIDDSQERLSAVVDDARKMPALPDSERTEANRVKGCVSQAWIAAELREGLCYFRSDADSPLVRGLLKFICDLYTGATPAEVTTIEPVLFEELGLARNLSPTRLNGLRSVRAKIREFAGAPPVERACSRLTASTLAHFDQACHPAAKPFIAFEKPISPMPVIRFNHG